MEKLKAVVLVGLMALCSAVVAKHGRESQPYEGVHEPGNYLNDAEGVALVRVAEPGGPALEQQEGAYGTFEDVDGELQFTKVESPALVARCGDGYNRS